MLACSMSSGYLWKKNVLKTLHLSRYLEVGKKILKIWGRNPFTLHQIINQTFLHPSFFTSSSYDKLFFVVVMRVVDKNRLFTHITIFKFAYVEPSAVFNGMTMSYIILFIFVFKRKKCIRQSNHMGCTILVSYSPWCFWVFSTERIF